MTGPAWAARYTVEARSAAETPALQRARIAYQDFFALWKDAEPDIPILEQAKAEHAQLN